MPRISLYRTEKSQDYKFHDRQASEMFTMGGTDLYLHKYLGTKPPAEGTADQPIYATQSPSNIQDLLLLENRDRKYEPDIYRIRGHYNVQGIDFNLSQFGLFLDNDTLFMTVHINDFINTIGRKPIIGDVFELPHLRDNFALNDLDFGLPRYYVIDDVGRAAEGFSPTWYPHLYRLKCKRITDSQQFADILALPATDVYGDPLPGAPTLQSVLSTRAKEYVINDAIIQQGEADAPLSGYETQQFYTLAVDPTTGKSNIVKVDADDLASVDSTAALTTAASAPVRTGYAGYLVGDGVPENGLSFGHGIQFPENPIKDDHFLRTDFLPNRLFRFDGIRWVKMEDSVRMNMTNNDTRMTQKTSFINNTSEYIYNDAVDQFYITLTQGDSIILTHQTYQVGFASAPYIVFKLDTTEISYAVADLVGQTLVTSYVSGSNTYLKLTLPIIDGHQQTIPFAGQWKVGLYKNREAVRQSLSKALRPKADF